MATKPVCSIDGCDKSARTLGMCPAHYGRHHRGEDVSAALIQRGHRMAWIRRHVQHSGDDCLKWPFRLHKSGQGSVFFEGRYQMVSRVMCRLAHGEPPEGKPNALHSCGKGHEACANPKHLRWGSQAENMQDAIAHGTTTRGARNAQASLTEEKVRQIRIMALRAPYKIVAKAFNITPSAVGMIARRERWGWLK